MLGSIDEKNSNRNLTLECNKTQYMQLLDKCCNYKSLVIE
jgi:hypothetical protein